jgi:hypothetical protein
MLKKIIFGVTVFFLVLGIVVFVNLKDTDRFECYLSGGVWKMYQTTCADFCAEESMIEQEDSESAITSPDDLFGDAVACGQAPVFSCDCGKDKCWDSDVCRDK